MLKVKIVVVIVIRNSVYLISYFYFIGRPFAKRFALCYRTVVCPVLSVCDVGVLWPNGWMDQDETWHDGRPRPRAHCVSYPQKGGIHPNFRPMSIVAKRLDG